MYVGRKNSIMDLKKRNFYVFLKLLIKFYLNFLLSLHLYWHILGYKILHPAENISSVHTYSNLLHPLMLEIMSVISVFNIFF